MARGQRWQITDVETDEELAGLLTGQDWTCCTGFRYGGYLWLNDSSGPDGAQEFAVVREEDHAQIESVTFGWLDSFRGLALIREIVAGAGDDFSRSYGHINPRDIETPEQHGRCRHCA